MKRILDSVPIIDAKWWQRADENCDAQDEYCEWRDSEGKSLKSHYLHVRDQILGTSPKKVLIKTTAPVFSIFSICTTNITNEKTIPIWDYTFDPTKQHTSMKDWAHWWFL